MSLYEDKLSKTIRKIKLDKIVNFSILNKKNLKLFIVGGFIRDILFNKRDSKIDADVVILIKSKNIEDYKSLIKCLCNECNYKIVELDNKNLVYRSIINQNLYLDFTYTLDLNQDFNRRDYTINSLYFDPMDKKLIDFDDCLNDIKNYLLKAHNLDNLVLDPIRMLRGIRFKNEFNLTFEQQTYDFIKSNFFHLVNTNPTRMKQELIKIFNLKKTFSAINDLVDLKFFELYDIKLNKPDELIQIIKNFDILYQIFQDVLPKEYEFSIKEKNYYLFLLLSSYILKNSRDLNSWGISLLFGENFIKKAQKILNDWNKREDPKYIINNFKHKTSNQIFEVIFINMLINISKINNEEYLSTLQTLFKVCNYVCELKRTIIPFDKYSEIFQETDYSKYIDYVISTLT